VRGKSGRRYAYGDDFDVGKANTLESRLCRTTPVGVYPNGTTPTPSPQPSPKGRGSEGRVYDLCGNVWEWTLSLWGRNTREPEFRYPYSERRAEREDVNAPSDVLRVLRGGAWDLRFSARAAVRPGDPTDFRLLDYGFRVACAPISSL
jgi:formylglycine-generating enzyme required for sulfatase activity